MSRNLQEWLTWQESLHLSAIDLGLDRIRVVAERMQLLSPQFPIITVAGTNGKGSTVALLSALLVEAGYTVGAYTSPHIIHYNERIAINREPVADEPICEAFAAIDAARGDISLTYFEFGTLAAMWVFAQANVDVVILEVGLGGRLDAANLWNASVAIVTGIGIDHIDWLGSDREVIGREKAGVSRAGCALICGDPEPPASIATVAGEVGADLWQVNTDFHVTRQAETFSVSVDRLGEEVCWEALPLPALLGDVQQTNAACALVALHQLRRSFPLTLTSIRAAMRSVKLAGRLQKLQSNPDVYLDVAHNPHAAQQLATWLQKNSTGGRTYMLFSILSDKDVHGVLEPLLDVVNEWHFFPLESARAMSLTAIHAAMEFHGIQEAFPHNGLKQAWSALLPRLKSNDRVVAFGSFLVVSSMLEDVV